MKNFLKISLIFTAALFCLNTVNAQNKKKDKKAARILTLQSMIDTANFTFNAQTAYPQHGVSKDLSSGYIFSISSGVATCDLPYSGQAYTAILNQDDTGIKFKTTHFDYFVDKQPDNSWNILVKPNGDQSTDMKDVQQIIISITTNGTAVLQVSFTNRERMTFNGEVERYKKD